MWTLPKIFFVVLNTVLYTTVKFTLCCLADTDVKYSPLFSEHCWKILSLIFLLNFVKYT
jgi:hypothetical protein